MSDDDHLDDDWFEQAVNEDDESDDAEADASVSLEPDGFETEIGDGATEDGWTPDRDEGPDPERAGEDGGDAAHTRSEGDLTLDPEADAGGATDSGLFDEDFGSALEDVEVPTDDGPSGGPADFADVDFDLGGPDQPDFDEAIESDLPRIDLGIEGLDRMIQGGVPERSLIVAIGSAGTGKTTFGLQFLERGLANGEQAVFISLEETRSRVIDSATEKGYPFDEYVDEGRLAIVDADPVEMANGLASIRSELPALIEDFGASRLVLDSVSLLEMMYDDRAKRRNEIYDFTQSLKEAGVTAMLTSEASEESPYASRHGIVEYLTDAVFVLQYVRPDDFRETRLAVEIQKIRDANHSRETKPYEITNEGISVYQGANLF